MYKKIGILALVTASLSFQSIHAVPVSGTLSFDGTAWLDGTTPGTSTEVKSWGALNKVDTGTSSFSGLGGISVNLLSPWFLNSGPLYDFWRFGGFEFDLGSSAAFDDNGTYLTVILTGNVAGNSFDTTPYIGRLTIQDLPTANGDFKYTANLLHATAPDGGDTALLLGPSLCALACLRHKMPAMARH